MKCKNIECVNDTIGKRVYCSLSCRNIYVNKYLRDYTKYSDTVKQKELIKENAYLENPKLCLNCNNIIPYNKKRNEYCGKDCSFSQNNLNRKGIKYNLTNEGKNILIKSALKNFHNHDFNKHISNINSYNDNPKLCLCCSTKIEFSKRKQKYCSKGCFKISKKQNLDNNYLKYKNLSKFKFSLNSYPNEFDFSLIEKYGWYSPSNKKNNLDGISRDHMISVREGFELGIVI